MIKTTCNDKIEPVVFILSLKMNEAVTTISLGLLYLSSQQD